MLFQNNLRFYSKWLKFHSLSSQFSVFSATFHCGANGQKAHLHTSGFSQLSESCTWHRKSNILFEVGNRKCSTGSMPSLCVGAKVVVNVTITADMVKCFAQATGDWNPIHFDAGKPTFTSGKHNSGVNESDQMNRAPIVHGALLNGLVSGVIGTRFPGPGTVVVSQAYKFTAPLLVGSQVAVKVEVVDFRRREVNVRYKVVSIPDETVVMDGTARLMVPRGRIGKIN